ncbi:MAG: flagellin [Alphaproteobacteria bacterium]
MSGVSTLGQALRQIEHLNSQQVLFSDLSSQLSTGKKTQFYSGLGTDALTSVRSRTEISSIDVYIGNIARADTTLSLTLTAVSEFQAQSEKFSSTLVGLVKEGSHQVGQEVRYDDPATINVEDTIVGNTSAKVDADMQAVFDHAENLYGFLGELLNTKEGDRYLLAGADSSQQPFSDTGTLDASINTLLDDWKNGAITTDELIADLTDGTALNGNPDAITDSAIGFSDSLSNGTAGNVFVRADESSELKYTTLANEDSFRNVMVALAVLKNENLPPVVDVYENGTYPGVADAQGAPGATAEEQQENFYKLFNAMNQVVSESIDEVDQVRFRMETVRAQMDETKTSHVNQKNLLLDTVSSVEDVDTNEVSVRITTLKTQLEASYSVTSLLQGLSLAKYI